MDRFNAKLLLVVCLFFACAASAQVAKTEAERFENGNRYLAEGNLDKALAEYDAVIRFNPRDNNAFGMRAHVKMIKGDFEGAIADYDIAIKLAPNAFGIEKAYNNRGIAYQFKGDHIRAFNEFDKAISINPKYASPYNGRGVIFERRGKLDLALADFNKALELNPLLTPAYSGRAGVEFQKGQLDLALADYNKAIELDPDGASPYLRRGVVQGMRNKWEFAVADFKRAFELQQMADFLMGGIISIAIFDLDKYLIANPKSARAYAARGFINLLRRKDPDAEKDFERSFRLEPALKKTLDEFITHIKETR